MATAKTTTTKTTAKAAPKKTATKTAAKVTKSAAPKTKKAAGPRHPLARVKALHTDKASLVKTIAGPLTASGEQTADVEKRLLKVSNHKLLHLADVVNTVTKKFGGRQQLIDAAGKAYGKTKDKPFLASLATMPLPRLLDLATSAQRRA